MITNIKQRLEVMGFSLHRVEHEFENAIREELENVKANRARRWSLKSDFLENTNFNDWLDALKVIFTQKQTLSSHLLADEKLIIRHLLDDRIEYGFPCYDVRCLLRAFLELCPDNGFVTLDITDLVANGYYYQEDAICEMAAKQLTDEHLPNEKIVLLTEGSIDKVILEQSLRLLYPHLFDYYSFMDFGVSNAAGGASFLVATIKAFIGSGIGNRIVALFDNDTAAHVARRGLAKTFIPNNIRVLSYPNLEFAKYYPTIGPSGISELDINGLACSIELYFGRDILTKDGKLTPIQWKGYDDNVRQYQGEILNKKELQDAFLEKVSQCNNNSNLISKMDWEPMKIVMQAIFSTFT